MPSDHPPLTQDRLKELLHYDPDTGRFIWIGSRGGTAAGSRAGARDSHGYIRISICGKLHLAHRLAFLYVVGATPPKDIDHINHVRDDNRWENLRPATRRENAVNTGPRRGNTSGHRGVTWDKLAGKWRAQSRCGGRCVYLGLHTSLEEAAAVADAWRKEHHGEFYSCVPNPDPLSPTTTPET